MVQIRGKAGSAMVFHAEPCDNTLSGHSFQYPLEGYKRRRWAVVGAHVYKRHWPISFFEVGQWITSLKICKLYTELHLCNGNGAFRANLNTGFATKTFVHVYWIGFSIDHLIYLRRTRIYTFFNTTTFVFIYHDFPHTKTSM